MPVLVDCDPDTWCMDLDQVEAASRRARGRSCRCTCSAIRSTCAALMEIAARHDLAIIEDAAEAHGAEVEGRRVGSFGDMGCFSFYANKIVTTGEGGMVRHQRRSLAERAALAAQPLLPAGRRFLHTEIGHNLPSDQPAGRARRGTGRAHRQTNPKQAPDGGAYQRRLSDLAAIDAAGRAELGQERLLDVWPRACRETAFDAVEFASASVSGDRHAAVVPWHARATGPARTRPFRRRAAIR